MKAISLSRWCNPSHDRHNLKQRAHKSGKREMRVHTISEMNKWASRWGGKCISKAYVNNHTKLEWECSRGHRWPATPGNIQKGKWCPHCAGNQRKTIDDMHRLAATHKGKCLSKEYVNNRTKLEWECSRGHRWPATPGNVQRDHWCPQCHRNSKGKTY